MNNTDDQEKQKSGPGLVGLASVGLCVVGIGAAFGAIAAAVNQEDFTGAGLCAVASALSFGAILNAFLRS